MRGSPVATKAALTAPREGIAPKGAESAGRKLGETSEQLAQNAPQTAAVFCGANANYGFGNLMPATHDPANSRGRINNPSRQHGGNENLHGSSIDR